jgi:hypothetical protein
MEKEIRTCDNCFWGHEGKCQKLESDTKCLAWSEWKPKKNLEPTPTINDKLDEEECGVLVNALPPEEIKPDEEVFYCGRDKIVFIENKFFNARERISGDLLLSKKYENIIKRIREIERQKESTMRCEEHGLYYYLNGSVLTCKLGCVKEIEKQKGVK